MSYDHWKTTNPADRFLGPDSDEPEEADDNDDGIECGRWDESGRLGELCANAGTEFCELECPYKALKAEGKHG